jgi:hypothetical protein
VLGILLLGLAIALYRTVRPGWPAHIAPVLMGVTGIGFLMSVAPTDHGPPNAPETWHGDMHSLGFIVAFLPLVLSMLLLAVSFRGDPRWRGYVWFGPVVGVLALIFFIGLAAVIPASMDQVAFYLTLLVLFVGITLIALRVRSLAGAT